MMGVVQTPLPLFCLFSFVLGAIFCLFRAVLGAAFALFSLLPKGENAPVASLRYAPGYFLWDVLFFLTSAVGYLVFLFATAGGVFRFYSLLLVLLGFFFFYPVGGFVFLNLSRFLLFLRSLLFRSFSFAASPFVRLFRRIFQKKKAKT